MKITRTVIGVAALLMLLATSQTALAQAHRNTNPNFGYEEGTGKKVRDLTAKDDKVPAQTTSTKKKSPKKKVVE